jgi:hypothetical protein
LVELESFSYDKKRISIVKRNHRKMNTALDGSVLCTSEEVIMDTMKSKMNNIYPGMAISHASFEKEIKEEREIRKVRIEISSLKHQVKYYQEDGGA